jgi:hypothetical protein
MQSGGRRRTEFPASSSRCSERVVGAVGDQLGVGGKDREQRLLALLCCVFRLKMPHRRSDERADGRKLRLSSRAQQEPRRVLRGAGLPHTLLRKTWLAEPRVAPELRTVP